MKNILLVLALVFGATAFAATESYTTSTPYGYGVDKVQKISWTGMNGGDVGQAIKSGNWTVKTFTVTGTFLAASATLQGSNDGVNFYTLTEAGTTSPVTLGVAGMKAIKENPLYIRPSVTGSASAALTFDLVLAK